jgi:hypothetical protein
MQNQSLEYRLKKDDFLCFVRIPKTGSTTLVCFLDAQFHLEEICPVLVADLPVASSESLAQYRLFRDHFDYDIYQYLPRKPVYITMLRHPIDRAISYYEFCKRCSNTGAFDQYLREAASKGLKEFITHPDSTIRIRNCNLQTRQLAAGLGSRHADPFNPSHLEEQYSDETLLSLAKEHLESFQFVGITEEFQRSLFLLSYTFGWYPVTDYQSLRVASAKSKKADLDQDTVEAILAVNPLDIELYQSAQMLFANRYAQMITELSAKYGSIAGSAELAASNSDPPLVSLLKHYEERYAEHKPPAITELDFDFLQPISGSGWHRRNGAYSGLIVTSTPFRWTGPGIQSTLDFPLATHEDLIIRIRITNAAAPDILDSLRLSVNDHPVTLSACLRRGTLAVFVGTIAQAVLKSERPLTRLTFHVNRTLSLQAVDPSSPDSRVVGLAVQRIQIFPATGCPKPASFADLFFPQTRSAWRATAEFLQSHLQPSEKVMAPVEFTDLLSHQFRSYAQPFLPDASWVVVRKGFLAEVHAPSLQNTLETMFPVFANEVFVLFTARSDLNRLPEQDPHLRSFHALWQQRQDKQGKTQSQSSVFAKISRWLSR